VQFDEDADLDTSQVSDQRGMGGRIAAGGGGLGIVGLIIYFLIAQLGGGDALPSGAGFGDVGPDRQVGSESIGERCRTGADANRDADCRAVAFINSIQSYWADAFAASGSTYREVQTNFFSGAVRTGCGNASSAAGPFYCPADAEVYIDLNFFTELRERFGATGGPFVEGYVLAHEYGHHVQTLNGTSARVRQGDNAASVRLELQADCLAGAWAKNATQTTDRGGQPLFTSITDADIQEAVETAEAIGDDAISDRANRPVNPDEFTHGSSAQRKQWFLQGYNSGDPKRCDTFNGEV